jgi:hypothetical protein
VKEADGEEAAAKEAAAKEAEAEGCRGKPVLAALTFLVVAKRGLREAAAADVDGAEGAGSVAGIKQALCMHIYHAINDMSS